MPCQVRITPAARGVRPGARCFAAPPERGRRGSRRQHCPVLARPHLPPRSTPRRDARGAGASAADSADGSEQFVVHVRDARTGQIDCVPRHRPDPRARQGPGQAPRPDQPRLTRTSAIRHRAAPTPSEVAHVIAPRGTGDLEGSGRRQHRPLCVRQPGPAEHGHADRQLHPAGVAGWRARISTSSATTCSTRSTSTMTATAARGHHLSVPLPYQADDAGQLPVQHRADQVAERPDLEQQAVLLGHQGRQARPPRARQEPGLPALQRRASCRRRTTRRSWAARRCNIAAERDQGLRWPAGRGVLRRPWLDLRPRQPAAVPAAEPLRQDGRPGQPARRERHRPAERALDRDPGADLAARAAGQADHRRLDDGQQAAGQHRRRRRRRRLARPARSRRCRGSATRWSTRSSSRWTTRTAGTGRHRCTTSSSRTTTRTPSCPGCCRSCTRACSRTSRRSTSPARSGPTSRRSC